MASLVAVTVKQVVGGHTSEYDLGPLLSFDNQRFSIFLSSVCPLFSLVIFSPLSRITPQLNYAHCNLGHIEVKVIRQCCLQLLLS